jgi:PAS domain S-box-containing protein
MDMITIQVLSILTNLALGLFLLLFTTVQKSYKAYQFWVWSHFTLALVYIFLGLRGIIPPIYSIIINNAFLILTCNFRLTACLQFFNHKVPLKSLFLLDVVFLGIIFYFSLWEDQIMVRTFFVTLLIFFTYASLGWILLKNRNKENSTVILFSIVVFGLYLILNVFRLSFVIWNPELVMFNRSTLFNSVYFTSLLILEIIWVTLFFALTGIRNRQEIREAKEHFEQIFKTSPEAILITRVSDGKILHLNEGFINITGYSSEEALGKSPLELSIWKNPEARIRMLDELKEKGSCNNAEFELRKKDTSFFTGIISSRIISVSGEEQLISITRDISERKEAELIIKEKNRELHELNLTKDKFFSIIAHDLRSPLSGFLGITQLMSEESDQIKLEDFRSLGKSLHESANNIYSLLENLLEWSRMQRGMIEFNPTTVDLYLATEEVLTNITDFSNQKGITIRNSIEKRTIVFADINMLNSILRNLVSNAVKFSNNGGFVEIGSDLSNQDEIKFFIKDSGIGMRGELIDRLFQIGEKVTRRGTGGETSTGLGLLLCKEFIDRHKGKIQVESEEKKGTTFWVSLPRANKDSFS